MHNADLGGPLPALRDPATGQNVGAMLQGRFTFTTNGDPNAIRHHLQGALIRATHQVVSQKLAQNQVALGTLPQSLPYYTQEIIQASGAAQMGAGIQELQLGIQLGAPAAAQPQQPYAPQGYGGGQPAMHGQFMHQNQPPQQQSGGGFLDNVEIKADIHIGGFHIKGSSSKGIDEEALAKQADEKAKSDFIWWIIGAVVVLAVIGGLGGLGIFIWYKVKHSGETAAENKAAAAASWDGKSPFSCGGSDQVKIEGVKAKLKDGTAIHAGASCHLELVDVEIEAPIAIETGASAVVTVKGGRIEGKDAAAKALGASKITFSGTKVTGKKEALGAAKIEGP